MLINISTSKQNQAVVTKLTAKLTGSTKENVIARIALGYSLASGRRFTKQEFGLYDSQGKEYLNSATVSINRLLDSKLSLWCLEALFECCISRDKPFHPLTPPSDLRQYAVENRQEI